MLKLLLSVRFSRQGETHGGPYREVNRPILWPVCPRVGETFWVSKTTDFFFDVARVVHSPACGQIEIVFETNHYDDLAGLLEEENGGWFATNQQRDWSDIVWPRIEDHPTATV